MAKKRTRKRQRPAKFEIIRGPVGGYLDEILRQVPVGYHVEEFVLREVRVHIVRDDLMNTRAARTQRTLPKTDKK